MFAFQERFHHEFQQQEALEWLIHQKDMMQKAALATDLSERKCNEKKKTLKTMEKDLKVLRKTQKASLKVIHQKWFLRGFGTKHPTVSLMLEYAALIPHSTSQVERVFFTMKLICTRLWKNLTTNSLSHYTRISKFLELTDDDLVICREHKK